ncbi:MAG: type II secretion system protein [Candidatus Komeilibacteria bacterium]|nr:type II secretion system protein [Candidatus Komeilibacteria bacterium]
MFTRVKSNQSGFTLVEILITMAIFTTAMTTVANIFLLSNRSQRKTQALQTSESDARFALEVISQQVRRGNIDYAYYGGAIGANPQAVLALLDNSGASVRFQRAVVDGRGVLQISQDSGVTWADLTPDDISINAVAFYLSPTTNPFASPPLSQSQPLVTIVIDTSNTTPEGATLSPTFLQTTISSRGYLR